MRPQSHIDHRCFNFYSLTIVKKRIKKLRKKKEIEKKEIKRLKNIKRKVKKRNEKIKEYKRELKKNKKD